MRERVGVSSKTQIARLFLCGLVVVGALLAPTVCLAAAHNAVLYHSGPSGLEAYNAWTRKTTTVVAGMPGTWGYPYWSPNRTSVVTIVFSRPDFPVPVEMYCSVLGSGTYLKAFEGIDYWMVDFEGWMDDYTAVATLTDSDENTSRYAIDTRTGARWWLSSSTPVAYPAPQARARTSGDKKYTVSVSRTQMITVRRRVGKKLYARYHLPFAGRSGSLTTWRYAACSISPDGKFLVYQLYLGEPKDHSQPKSRTYVCTLGGKSVRRIKNDWGGFQWR